MLRPCRVASRGSGTALRILCLLFSTAVPALATVPDWYDPVRGQDYWKSVWRQRSIYAIQADRWDTTEPAQNECTTLQDLTKYCGGNFKGIERRTDYLKGMNVDAFMMSSVTDNTPGCGHYIYWDCSIPPDFTRQQNLFCRLAGLPDLNQDNPFVRDKLKEWVQWLRGEYGFTGLRIDALANIDPQFAQEFTRSSGLFALGELPTAAASVEKVLQPVKAYYDLPNGLGLLDFFTVDPIRNVFCGEWRCFTGFGVGKNLKDYESRQPMWLSGFNRGKPTYVFVRMLNWYRWKMGLWDLSLEQVYLDDNHYGFRRGTSFLVVITNGLGPLQPSLNFYNLQPGVKLCNVLHPGQCITGDANGNATTTYSPGGEPMIFVLPSVYHPLQYFVPADAIPVAWQKALLASVVTITASFVVGLLFPYLLVLFFNKKTPPPAAIVVSSSPNPAAGGVQPVNRPSAALQRWRLRQILKSFVAKKRALVASAAAASSIDANNHISEAGDSDDGSALPDNNLPVVDEDSSSVGKPDSPMSTIMDEYELAEGGLNRLLNTHDIFSSQEGRRGPLMSTMKRTLSETQLEALSVAPPPALPATSAWDKVQTYVGMLAHMQLHIALEYSVPHLGHTSSLMYGGLGKMVDIFIRHSQEPIAICAPMYKPWYEPDSGMDQLQLMLSFDVAVGDKSHLVEVFSATYEERVVFLLLQADVFRTKTRGTIHSFANEEDQLTALSIFNQATGRIIAAFGFRAVQFHDYHGVMSLQYLPPAARPSVLYVAHNSDYNGVWPLGSSRRQKYLYSMFNLPMTPELQGALEHEGNFNMLRSVVEHIAVVQSGHGLIAVSPRYATRILRKFSVMWPLRSFDHAAGILNGIDGLPELPDDIQVLMAGKQAAKVAFQRQHGLEVSPNCRLLVFVGRMTHQKGSDLLVGAVQRILAKCPDAQVAVGGPVGDWNGKAAAKGFAKIQEKFAGRLWNGAGQYIDGAVKDLLLEAADFFLCPSRFEPCGLTDIEFGKAGALIIGHDTGGLGKMPGWYFKEDLDNATGMSNRLAEVALAALKTPPDETPPDEVLAKVEEAVASTFPPEVMIQKYQDVWATIHAVRAPDSKIITDAEKTCYNALWQLLAFRVSAHGYFVIASVGFVLTSLASLWATYAVRLAGALTLITFIGAPAGGPIIGFIFVDQRNRVSVSEFGPALMGLSDGIKTGMIFCAMLVILVQQGRNIPLSGYHSFGIILLATAVWLLLFILSDAMPAIFRYFHLTIRGQVMLLMKHRKTWYTLVILSGLKTFLATLIAAAVYTWHGWAALEVYGVLYFGVGCASIVFWAYVLSRNIGRLRHTSLMYGLTLFPGITFAQMCCVLWGKADYWVVIAGTVFQVGMVRYHMAGVLTLHTLSSRQMLSIVLTMQTVVGSLAIGAGGVVGYLIGRGYGAKIIDLSLAGVGELARAGLVLLLIKWHRAEHIAIP
ncbi:hypothetical protein WJX72_012213 [[Myrmecia] bisecta]|uniref:Glycosyl hydrolase family 13 catalytic domain-containing protein n=1 Tax=[Myrmecia] bisecta TaxID=41462 RepID=A0AAW1Q5I1_9CHLO